MIPVKFDYVRPSSLAEAVAALADGGDDAKVIAGGQSLLPLLRLRLANPEVLVDVGGLDDLHGVRDEGDSLLMLLDQHAQGLFTLPKIVEKAAHNPARLFGIVERGFIREGYFADLVAVDLAAKTRVDAAQVRYKCGWSPFEGTEFHSRVDLTVLNGQIVYRDGRPGAARAARALEFRRR